MKRFLFLFSAICLFASNSMAGLMITPSRLEFKDDIKSQEVKLINKSNETVTYRVSLQHLRMNEKGEYVEIADTQKDIKEQFADDLIRYSPRKITLKANEVQTIRVALKKSDNITNEGEYRSHILFREEPSADFRKSNDVEAVAKKDDKKISIVLRPLFGISIPVIVTQGKTSVETSISNMEVKSNANEKSKKILTFVVNREGTASAFGNFIVTFKSNKTGKEYEIGALNAVSVFYPYPKRIVSVNLNLPKDVSLTDGVVNVKFLSRSDDAEKQVLAQKSITIN